MPWDHLPLSTDTGPSRLRQGREPGVKRVLRNPVVQFLVASLLLFGVIWWGTGRLSQTAACRKTTGSPWPTTFTASLAWPDVIL